MTSITKSERLVVYLIDDDEAVRSSLELFLSASGFAVHAYDAATEFVQALPNLEPGCIVTDIRMPGMDGLQLVQKLQDSNIKLPIICITGHADVPMAIKALKAGVADFIEKPFPPDVLATAIRAATEAGERQLTAAAAAAEIEDRMKSLTPREREVLDALVAGSTNKGIGRDLGMSPRTVENHRARIMLKMKARSLSELIRLVLSVMRDT